MIYLTEGQGIQIVADVTNETSMPMDTNYASVTAPAIVLCEVLIDGEVVEAVYAGNGGSHSWWTPAGGKFFPPHIAPSGLKPGSRLQVRVSGECALRIDWID